jgi:hypothetical protein
MHRAQTHISKASISIGILLALVIGLLTMIPSAPQAVASDDTPDKLSFLGNNAYVTQGATRIFEDVRPGVDAEIEVVSLTNVNVYDEELDPAAAASAMRWIDETESDPEENRWLYTQIVREDGNVNSGWATAKLKISFFDVSGPVIFSTLRVNAYDIDYGQYVEFENVESWEFTPDTIVSAIPQTNSRHQRFLSEDIGATDDPVNHEDGVYDAVSNTDGQVNSFGEARVRVNFTDVSEVILTMGIEASNGSQQFDFGLGQVWTSKNNAAIPGLLESSSGTGGQSSFSPSVTLVSPLAPANVTTSRNISLFGTNLDTVTEVYVGGKKLRIRKQTANQIDIRLPRGLSGLVDLELKSTLNNLLSPKHFNYGGVAATATRKAKLIVGGFAHNSRVLTPRMKNRIDRWLERNSDLGTLTCTGFTSLPRRTTDVALSTNRGITACKFSKKQRSQLETSVSKGIEDPRPGSNVRRVRLVLTP